MGNWKNGKNKKRIIEMKNYMEKERVKRIERNRDWHVPKEKVIKI